MIEIKIQPVKTEVSNGIETGQLNLDDLMLVVKLRN